MHYILLDIVLELGKKNIQYIKLDDIKKNNVIEKKINEPKNDALLNDDFFENDLILNSSNDMQNTFIEDFANIDNNNNKTANKIESHNIVADNKVTDIQPTNNNEVKTDNKTTNTKPNNNEVQTDNKINQNQNIETKKSKKKQNNFKDTFNDVYLDSKNFENLLLQSEQEDINLDQNTQDNKNNSKYPDIPENSKLNVIKNKLIKLSDKTQKVRHNKDKNSQNNKNTNNIIDNIVNKVDQVVNDKMDQVANNTKAPEKNLKKTSQTTPEIKIIGTLYDSELNHTLNQKFSLHRNIPKTPDINKEKELTYHEDEEYEKFFNDEKNKNNLKLEDKISVPNIKPKPKEVIMYRQIVPNELLENRSFQNRHIPKILKQEDNEDALEKIIQYGMLNELKAYILYYNNANYIMSNSYSLLTYATKYKQYKLMKYLIHVGADVNKTNNMAETPLMVAVKNNDINAIDILIRSGAKIDVFDNFGRTPLIYCIEKNLERVGAFLVSSGADIHLKNIIDEDMLEMAIRYNRNMIQQSIVERLLEEKKQK